MFQYVIFKHVPPILQHGWTQVPRTISQCVQDTFIFWCKYTYTSISSLKTHTHNQLHLSSFRTTFGTILVQVSRPSVSQMESRPKSRRACDGGFTPKDGKKANQSSLPRQMVYQTPSWFEDLLHVDLIYYWYHLLICLLHIGKGFGRGHINTPYFGWCESVGMTTWNFILRTTSRLKWKIEPHIMCRFNWWTCNMRSWSDYHRYFFSGSFRVWTVIVCCRKINSYFVGWLICKCAKSTTNIYCRQDKTVTFQHKLYFQIH